MVYKHADYTLFVKHIHLKNIADKTYPMYFFSKKLPKSGEPCDIPDGYLVKVNEKSGLPFLKRK